MIRALRVISLGVAASVLVAAWPSAVFAQGPAPEPPGPSAARWLPGVSIGVGVASVGTEGTNWDRQPFVGSIRVEFSRLFVVEAEWTQAMSAKSFYDSGDVGLATLNGQSGIYGRVTWRSDYRLGTNSVAVLARSRMGRVSFLGGAGLAQFASKSETVSTRTGCTGPWVVACYDGSRTSTYNRTGTGLIVVGGIDVDVLPRVQAFVSGRIGGSNAVEEAGRSSKASSSGWVPALAWVYTSRISTSLARFRRPFLSGAQWARPSTRFARTGTSCTASRSPSRSRRL